MQRTLETNFLTIDALRSKAESFAEGLLDDYTRDIKAGGRSYTAGGRSYTRKEVNDPLWGTIGLSGPEVALLDSPLLQRLRFIRQLGVVHWVYPGAIHTRFEHTLGVLRQVHHLSEAVNIISQQKGYGLLLTAPQIQLLRYAALLHDVGHSAFSHVAEMAIESLPTHAGLLAQFSRSYRTENKKLSEIVAFFVVRSPAMRRFVETIIDFDSAFIQLHTTRGTNVEKVIDGVSKAIIGQNIDDRLPLLHEIISGPFDADKLDYFKRDSYCAGTPCLLDISRLIQKITIKELDSISLPSTIAKTVRQQPKYYIFGLKWSGISVLDELHLSRVLLYAKIYRHPKVVAIEQMLKSSITLLAGMADPLSIFDLVYNYDDDEIIKCSPEALAVALGLDLNKLSEGEVKKVRKAHSVLQDIRLRCLFEKAFQLQRTYPSDPRSGDESQKDGLIHFREVVEQPIEREALKQNLLDRVEKIISLLGISPKDRIDLEGSIMIHPIGQTPGGTQIGRAFLLPNIGSPIEFRDYLVNRTAWADGYLSDQPAGYVFAERPIADIVYVALEHLLRVEFGVCLPLSAQEASKRSEETINDLKKRLHQAGYYKSAPFDIRPVTSRLKMADVEVAISDFSEKLQKYQRPENNGESKAIPHKEFCRRWLQQFDNEESVECAIRIIQKFRMIDRHDTVKALKTFIERNQEFIGSIVIPFGSARDSSAVQTYFSADLEGSYISRCMTFEEATKQSISRPIVFVDDFVGSGGQGKDVLAAGFGRDDLRADLGEQRDLFDSNIQYLLKQSNVAFVFTAAWDAGITEIEATAKRLELQAKVFRLLGEDDIPFMERDCFNGLPEDQIASFLRRCREVGRSVLADYTTRRPDDTPDAYEKKLEQRALGYGNRGMLLASPFNVPSQTLTAIWGHGEIDGVEWTPFLPRRKKT